MPVVLDALIGSFENMRDNVRDYNARESEELQIAFSLRRVEAEVLGEDPDAVSGPDREPANYLHLKDVRVYHGHKYHEMESLRLDMRSVDGWALGTFDSAQPEGPGPGE